MPKPAPKSVSLVRGLRADDVVDRAIAYQHETSRCGDPHLHTRVIVPNRQARADGDNLGTRSDRLVPHHDRLQCGHQIAMAADALAAYKADTAAGKDALLRMRRHRDGRRAEPPHPPRHHQSGRTHRHRRGQRITAGDLILSRRNDITISIYDAAHDIAASDSVRNGNRWQAVAIDTVHNRIAAEQLSDGARAIFDDDYVREYITYGYAQTVHAAQDVTADTTHAVLSETTSRPLAYVAMTRARESNNAYLYERATEAGEYTHDRPDGTHHLMRRGDSHTAANVMRTIIATDGRAQTAHDFAARTDAEHLPARMARLLVDRRVRAVRMRRAEYRRWQSQQWERQADLDRAIDQHRSRGRKQSTDYSLDLCALMPGGTW